MSSNEPEVPLLPLQVAAVSMHENVVSFVEAGFTRQEAVQIVTAMLLEAIRLQHGGAGSE